tara:strand:- start:31614 stop:32351 length:738 start_codon:yes stop_codon:yes gene_type:complete
MIERKFTELVEAFLKGEIGPTESTWLVEELHKRRDRRDLFSEKIEDYLEFQAGPRRRESDRQLRELLTRDLTTIVVRDIELAKPRRSAPVAAPEIPAAYQSRRESDDPVVKREAKEYVAERMEVPQQEKSLVMPILGILIIIGTFFVMFEFSSLKGDEELAEEKEEAVEDATNDATAFREVTEYLSETSSPSESESQTEADDEQSEPARTGQELEPVSLVDLVGGESENTAGAGSSDEPVVLQNP